nr:putative transcription elongation factor SPT5 homolog 1 [Tanacetum cinerariifolium]
GGQRSRAYEAPTPGLRWANTSGGSYSEAGTPRDNTPAYANAPSPYLPSTPGGQPPMTPCLAFLSVTPRGADLDIMSPGVGGDNDEPWFLPDILVNVRRSSDDVALGVIQEVLLWAKKVPWYSEPIPSIPYDPLVLRHAFEKDLIHFLICLKVSITYDQEDVELDIDDIEIDEPVLVVPTSSHTKRKEEIGKRTDRQKLFDDDNADPTPRLRTREEIIAKYRKAGNDASSAAGEARNKLLERQEKLERINKRTQDLSNEAEDFASLAQELVKAMERRKIFSKDPFPDPLESIMNDQEDVELDIGFGIMRAFFNDGFRGDWALSLLYVFLTAACSKCSLVFCLEALELLDCELDEGGACRDFNLPFETLYLFHQSEKKLLSGRVSLFIRA